MDNLPSTQIMVVDNIKGYFSIYFCRTKFALTPQLKELYKEKGMREYADNFDDLPMVSKIGKYKKYQVCLFKQKYKYLMKQQINHSKEVSSEYKFIRKCFDKVMNLILSGSIPLRYLPTITEVKDFHNKKVTQLPPAEITLFVATFQGAITSLLEQKFLNEYLVEDIVKFFKLLNQNSVGLEFEEYCIKWGNEMTKKMMTELINNPKLV